MAVWWDVQRTRPAEPYFGTRGTFFADIDNDGTADAIAVNDNFVTLRQSTGLSFGANKPWTTSPYFGDIGNFAVDVTGDGRADVIRTRSTRDCDPAEPAAAQLELGCAGDVRMPQLRSARS